MNFHLNNNISTSARGYVNNVKNTALTHLCTHIEYLNPYRIGLNKWHQTPDVTMVINVSYSLCCSGQNDVVNEGLLRGMTSFWIDFLMIYIDIFIWMSRMSWLQCPLHRHWNKVKRYPAAGWWVPHMVIHNRAERPW